jgi:hypothetical protein
MRRVRRRAPLGWCRRECPRPWRRTTQPPRRTLAQVETRTPSLSRSVRAWADTSAALRRCPDGTRVRLTARHGGHRAARPSWIGQAFTGIDRHGVEARLAPAQLCGSVGVAASVVARNPDYGWHPDHHDDASLVDGDVLDQNSLAPLHAQQGTRSPGALPTKRFCAWRPVHFPALLGVAAPILPADVHRDHGSEAEGWLNDGPTASPKCSLRSSPAATVRPHAHRDIGYAWDWTPAGRGNCNQQPAFGCRVEQVGGGRFAGESRGRRRSLPRLRRWRPRRRAPRA